MMFHDDDAVPDIDGKSAAQVRKETNELKKKLEDAGVAAEMVAPRLWFSPMTVDGAYTSNDPKCRKYAIAHGIQHGIWGGTSPREPGRAGRTA